MTASRTFRPRATLMVCVALAAAFVGGAVLVMVMLDRTPGNDAVDGAPAIAPAVVVLVVAGLLGRVRARADDAGLDVRNPFRRRRLAWAQIVAVRLGRNDPWVLLDLTDGTSCAVMAVQAADGARARRDAQWLRDRVREHEGRET